MLSFLTDIPVAGFPLWSILLIFDGVFLAGFIDAIAGGGGIISVPAYLLAFSGYPPYYVLGTNKLSSCIGTFFSTARYIKNGLALPSFSPFWVPSAAPGCSTIRRTLS